ncbi:MAG: TonB family protein [Candidatus Binatia bacterium]|nr:TonB family protein [Candidatus Binatia bacterium]
MTILASRFGHFLTFSLAVHAAVGLALRQSIFVSPRPPAIVRVQILPEQAEPAAAGPVRSSPSLPVAGQSPPTMPSAPTAPTRRQVRRSGQRRTQPAEARAARTVPKTASSPAELAGSEPTGSSEIAGSANTGAGFAAGLSPGQAEGRPAPDPVATYLAQVRALLDAHKRYPEQARRLKLQGIAVIAFEISPSGSVRNMRVVSADDSLLGLAALHTLKQAARAIGPPPTKRTVPVEVALRFELQPERSMP